MKTRQDFVDFTARIQMDVRSGQNPAALAKLVELRAHLVNLDLPEGDQPFNERAALALVRNTAHEYTDRSLTDELARMGANQEFIDEMLELAQSVRNGATEQAA